MASHYASSHYASSHHLPDHYNRVVAIVEPDFTPDDVVHPPRTHDDAEARWRRIMLEDELLLLVIKVWLDVKDR